MPLMLGLGGLALGGAKAAFIDQPQYEKKKQLASATQRYSPWTGMQAQAPNQPNALGDVMQGGMAGAQLGQGLQAANAASQLGQNYNAWLQAQTNALNGGMAGLGASPLNSMYSGADSAFNKV